MGMTNNRATTGKGKGLVFKITVCIPHGKQDCKQCIGLLNHLVFSKSKPEATKRWVRITFKEINVVEVMEAEQ